MPNISTFSAQGLNSYLQSGRAKIDGKMVSRLVQLIAGAKHFLSVAIYDIKNPDVLKALRKMSSKVQLRIRCDSGSGSKVGGGSATVDPKVPTGKAIIDARQKQFARPIHDTGQHLMRDKFLVRDGSSVWTRPGYLHEWQLVTSGRQFSQDRFAGRPRKSGLGLRFDSLKGETLWLHQNSTSSSPSPKS